MLREGEDLAHPAPGHLGNGASGPRYHPAPFHE